MEVELATRKHIVVEGRSDARFFRAWLLGEQGVTATITSVDTLDVPTDDVVSAGLTDSNRSRVIVVAERAHNRKLSLRCVVDRDCGEGVGDHKYQTLIWTDYPAIESYAVTANVLETVNLLSFSEKLPAPSLLLPSLAHALRELFAVRLQHPHLEKPNYAAGLGKGVAKLEGFDVSATVPPSLATKVAEYPRPPSDADPRTYAYGHDVGELLLAAFANALKNQAGMKSLEVLEGALRSAIQAEGSYVREPMFVLLGEWLSSDVQPRRLDPSTD